MDHPDIYSYQLFTYIHRKKKGNSEGPNFCGTQKNSCETHNC